MWVCFVLSLVLAVITVSCISIYGHKSHLHECKSYSNTFTVKVNTIALCKHTAALYTARSVLLLGVVQCCDQQCSRHNSPQSLSSRDTRNQIRIVEQMLKSAGKFGFSQEYQEFFPDSSDSVDSAILKRALSCPSRIRVSRGQLYTTF